MRKIFLAAALSICATAANAAEDFKRVVQIIVTDSESAKVEHASIEVDGETLCTDDRGIAYLDVPPGKYAARVSKSSCVYECEIEVTEKTGFISLRLSCD